MYSLHLTHPKWTHTRSSGPAMLQRPGSSWGFGALLKDTSVMVLKEDTPPPTIPAGPEIQTHNLPLTSPTRYPLGHDWPPAHDWPPQSWGINEGAISIWLCSLYSNSVKSHKNFVWRTNQSHYSLKIVLDSHGHYSLSLHIKCWLWRLMSVIKAQFYFIPFPFPCPSTYPFPLSLETECQGVGVKIFP